MIAPPALALLGAALTAAHAAPLDGLGPHARQRAHPPAVPPPADRPPPPTPAAPPPDAWVYGYYATWSGELTDLDWSRLTHVAVFSVDLNADGSLDQESLWAEYGAQAVSLAEPHGVRVHLTLTCFDDAVMSAVLPSDSRRAATVSRLSELVEDVGAHGVSVDCEGMDAPLRDDFVSFVTELQAAVPEVTVALPSVDWSDAYDYAALSSVADALFLMGYGYHWSTGDPGPVAPLVGGDPWASWSLAWSVDDYLSKGVPPDRLVLGLPLYGRDWPSTDTSIPGTATGRGEAVVMVDAIDQAAVTGRLWDDQTSTPYTFPDANSQLWYDDHASIQAKIGWAMDEGLLGVGFWALNYEGGDPDFWQMVAEQTTRSGGGGDTGPRDTGSSSGTDGTDGTDGVDAARPDTGRGVQPGPPPGDRVPLFGCATRSGRALGALAIGLLAAVVPRRRLGA